MVQERPISRDRVSGDSGAIVASRTAAVDRAPRHQRPVTHGYAALTFCTGGRSRVEQNGELTLGEGDVLLVPAGAPHRMIEMQRLAYWGLAVSVSPFASGADAALLDPFERVRDGASAVVHVPPSRQTFFESLFRELAEAPREPAVQRSLLTLIVAEIARATSAAPRLAPRVGGVVTESLRFIERNCLRRLTVEDVATAVGRTPTYVTTALTQATGRSAVAWIVGGRMAEARRLLVHSDERVDVIAERVGYADPTHFIRMFRRTHGQTPAAWRAATTRAADGA